jgi:putative Ig domain-containing protein
VVSVQVIATDPDGDPLTYSANNLPAGLGIDPGTGLISGTLAAGASAGSPYSVQVSASDGGSTDTESFLWTVLSVPNQPPQVQNPGNRTNTEGDVVSLQVIATDPENNPLTYSAGNLPAGLSINPGTGLISGTVAFGAAAGSPYSVQVGASDGSSTDTETFQWTVLVPANYPATPTGLTISGDTLALRLDWANNTELNLAGYNVYRSDGVGPYTKLNGALLTLSQYIDATAAAGATSFYRVTAVNTLGNESAPAAGSARRSKIVFRSSTSAKGKSTSVKISRPGGVVAGDVLVAAVILRSSAGITAPAGWTEVRSDLNGTALRQAMFVRVAAAGEPASYTWTLGASSASAGIVLAYSGAVIPAAVSGGQANPLSFSITAPDVSNPTAYSLQVGAFGSAENGGIAPPAGMLEQREVSASAGKLHASIELSDDVLDPVGPAGARVAAASKAALGIGQVVILNPAP